MCKKNDIDVNGKVKCNGTICKPKRKSRRKRTLNHKNERDVIRTKK